jgi:hypothetical protein
MEMGAAGEIRAGSGSSSRLAASNRSQPQMTITLAYKGSKDRKITKPKVQK